MNAHSPIEPTTLAKLREPFPDHQVSKLPKPLAKREVMDTLPKAKCRECGQFHATSKVIHLDYVGHAALTDRLLDTDEQWSWEPVAFGPDGLPALDRNGGLWIKLTVLGVTRLGYGDADGKQGGNAIKEAIGDALRNAAMRFGAALDLWHKGDLHAEEETTENGTSGDNTGDRQMSSAGPAASNDTGDQPQASRNWGGRYPTKTALRKARTIHHAELERLATEGTFDDLDAYLTSPEYKDYITTASEHFPLWLEGVIPPELSEQLPPEYIQTFRQEQKTRDLIAIRGNFPAAEYITERN